VELRAQVVERVVANHCDVVLDTQPVVVREQVVYRAPLVETAAIILPQVQYQYRQEAFIQRELVQHGGHVAFIEKQQQRDFPTPIRDALQNVKNRAENRQANRQAVRAANKAAVILKPQPIVVYH
jgi:hypothetical protein